MARWRGGGCIAPAISQSGARRGCSWLGHGRVDHAHNVLLTLSGCHALGTGGIQEAPLVPDHPAKVRRGAGALGGVQYSMALTGNSSDA